MNWRAVMFSLASLGLLSITVPQGARAQGHPRGNPGGFRFAPGAGARGRFAAPGYGGPGFGGPGPGAYGGQRYGAPGFAETPYSVGYGRGAYGRGAFGRGPYGQAPYAPEPYGGRYPDGGARPDTPQPYPPYAGLDRGRPFARGDWRDQQNEVRQAVRDGRHIPLGRAIDAVRQRTPGRELDAGLEPGPGGRALYRLRWAASNGRRIDYLVDAATGAIVDEQGGR